MYYQTKIYFYHIKQTIINILFLRDIVVYNTRSSTGKNLKTIPEVSNSALL